MLLVGEPDLGGYPRAVVGGSFEPHSEGIERKDGHGAPDGVGLNVFAQVGSYDLQLASNALLSRAVAESGRRNYVDLVVQLVSLGDENKFTHDLERVRRFTSEMTAEHVHCVCCACDA